MAQHRVDGELVGDALVVSPFGELTADLAAHVRSRISDLYSRHSLAGALVVDLRAVSLTDSTGVAALVRFREFAHAHGLDCRLVGIGPRDRHLLERTDLLAVFGSAVSFGTGEHSHGRSS